MKSPRGATLHLMVGYIREIVDALLVSLDPRAPRSTPSAFDLVKALAEEVARLDPRDFVPSARYQFVAARASLRPWVASNSLNDQPQLKKVATEIRAVVEQYGGPGSAVSSRSFRWLSDPDLRVIVERDYAELATILIPDGAWKSAVVLAGSILEAVLLDLLVKDAARLALAKASPSAPKKKGAAKPEDEWTLDEMIKVATAISLVATGRADTFDQVLRDYRNFIHPAKETRAAHPCGEGEALMAHGALVAVCDHFDRMFP